MRDMPIEAPERRLGFIARHGHDERMTIGFKARQHFISESPRRNSLPGYAISYFLDSRRHAAALRFSVSVLMRRRVAAIFRAAAGSAGVGFIIFQRLLANDLTLP